MNRTLASLGGLAAWLIAFSFDSLASPGALHAYEENGAPLEVFPKAMNLAGAGHRHGLIVMAKTAGSGAHTLVKEAQITVEPPNLGQVESGSTFVAKSAGKGTIKIVRGGLVQSIAVQVGNRPLGEAVSFRNDIIPMLTRSGCNSGACHGALAGKGTMKLSLRGYDPEADLHVLTTQQGARRTDRTQPALSLFVRKGLGELPHGGGKKWKKGSVEEMLAVKWVEQGSVGPAPTDSRLVRIVTFPPALQQSPNSPEPFPLLVQAEYSNGLTADVTGWAKFASSSEEVAGVDQEGQIRTAGSGESGVSAWFDNQVAITTLTAPRAGQASWAKAARNDERNWIDTHVGAKLAALGIPASPLSNDMEYLRRVGLDLCGTLPSVEDQKAFLGLPKETRRAAWVDILMKRPEFSDYQAYKLADLFLISTKKIPQSGVWAFSRFLRQSIEENRPWDRLCRDILTAQGSSLDRGEINFFLMHRDPAELTEAVSVTFMGMSVTCAKCHNHPLEKWTQDQYWGMANLFGRVNLKSGNRPDEVILVEAKSGDAIHIRKGIPIPPQPLDGPVATGPRREAFANWLTAPENPWFARAQVNRIWKSLLGRGLVENDDDLRVTNPATHPELLDQLAAEFVRSRFDMRHMIRLITQSAAYQRSSRTVPGNETDDRFYSHARLKRLQAEILLDAYAQVTGVPTRFTEITPGGGNGSQPYAGYPLGTRAIQLPDSAVVSPFLDAFGRPERNQACSCERQQESTVGQALHVANGSTLNEKLKNPDGLAARWAKDGSVPEAVMDRLWQSALCRLPTAQEKARSLPDLKAAWAGDLLARQESIEDLFWAVLTSREFLLNH